VVLQGWLNRCRVLAIVAGATLLFFAGACDISDRSPTRPEAEAGYTAEQAQSSGGPAQNEEGRAGFFPLEIGNRWTYGGETSLVTELYETGAADSAVFHTEEDHVLIGTETRSGREYVVEMQEQRDLATGKVTAYWIRYRQDQAGLYEADVSVIEPPVAAKQSVSYAGADVLDGRWEALWRQVADACDADSKAGLERAWRRMEGKLDVVEAIRGFKSGHVRALAGPPGGVLSDEITRLEYPLHPGQEWTVRESPFFGSEVEGHDVLDLPPGKMTCLRIRMVSEVFGPSDSVVLWYGRDGFLGMSAHVESEVLGLNGEPMGRIVFEDRLFLETIDLVRPGRF
jgi:hypothetical protein